jgi:osmotically-inducible protein OsmY
MMVASFAADSRRPGVTVHDGIVTLTGHPQTQQAGRELVKAVRHIDGVMAIRDQLSHAGTPR